MASSQQRYPGDPGLPRLTYRSQSHAQAIASELGLGGTHPHTVSGKSVYMPGTTHAELNSALRKRGLSETPVPNQEMSLSMTQRTPDIVGVDNTTDDPDVPGFKGAHFRTVSVPPFATPGENVTITGAVHYDNLGRVVSPIPVRAKIESPAFNEPRYSREYNLTHCQTRTVSFNIPAQGNPGQQLAVTVKAQNKTAIGWQTTDSVGPRRIELLSEDEAQERRLLGFVPYAAGGAIAGTVLGDGETSSTVVGAAAGAGSKYVVDNTNVVSEVGGLVPDIPTTQIAIIGGALGLGALFISQADDYVPPDVVREPLRQVQEAASGAVDTVDVSNTQ